MLTSGTTPVSTTSDTAVNLVTVTGAPIMGVIGIINTGSAGGFFSLDGGTTWGYIPAIGSVAPGEPVRITGSIMVKRIPGGSNMSGVYGWVLLPRQPTVF